MEISINIISGVMLGFEFVSDEDGDFFVLDLFFIRLLFEKA